MNSFVPVQSFALQPFQMSANRNPIPQSDLVFHYNVYGGMQSGIGKFDPGPAMMLKNQLDSLGFIECKPFFSIGLIMWIVSFHSVLLYLHGQLG